MKTPFVTLAAVLVAITGCASHPAPPPVVKIPPPPPTPLTSPGTKFALLPSAVQRTVVAFGGAAEIKNISKTAMDEDVYQIQFKDPGTPTLLVAEDGSPLNGPTPMTPPPGFNVALPPPVQWSLDQEAPHAIVTDIQPSETTVYAITFADTNSHPRMLILEDGTVLKTQ